MHFFGGHVKSVMVTVTHLINNFSSYVCYVPYYLLATGYLLTNKFVFIRQAMVAQWLACWTHAQKGPGSNCNRDAVG